MTAVFQLSLTYSFLGMNKGLISMPLVHKWLVQWKTFPKQALTTPGLFKQRINEIKRKDEH